MLCDAEAAGRAAGGVRFGPPTLSVAEERELVMREVLPSMAAKVYSTAVQYITKK
jgi:hypothetical protein